MKPYYQDELITLYHGDSREILPLLQNQYTAIITDPVWPNAPESMFPGIDPVTLFKQVSDEFARISKRIVIHLGVDSDPRILIGLPEEFKFIRCCWLRYAFPNPKGRILYSGDIAYIYGDPPKNLPPGKKLLPGEYHGAEINQKNGHPCPRKLSHVKWLIKWFGEDGPVLDPFVGSGTTMEAAKIMGIPAVGIDINEVYLKIAADRSKRTNLLQFNHSRI